MNSKVVVNNVLGWPVNPSPHDGNLHMSKDISGPFVLSVSTSAEKLVVTMRRAGLIKLHCLRV
ncbi:Hypothetical protein PHPALM_36344 [Phytophthora palmivora]|uniref:Uncharacterized protein n=1 Tax=Phytophthora palmivora TaxID=4796 RepID=A0A2P4X053_9STRA|nr:Hypothetical protein PHPALM_36344 [Phytophthora palmivora]